MIVDQFEELFTLCRDREERDRFIGMLLPRRGNDLSLDLAPYSATGAGQRLDDSAAVGVMDGETVLSCGGRVIGRSGPIDIALTTPTAAKRHYTLTARTTRKTAWTALGTRSSATWGFTSSRSRGSAPLPLRAAGAVDLTSAAPASRSFRLPLTVQRPAGAERTPVTRLTLQVSYDDGRTWNSVPVSRRGATGSALLHHPNRAGYASLRISASDKAGSTVTQTVIRAYRIATAH